MFFFKYTVRGNLKVSRPSFEKGISLYKEALDYVQYLIAHFTSAPPKKHRHSNETIKRTVTADFPEKDVPPKRGLGTTAA